MTDEEAEKIYEDMLRYFEKLPNPEHEPISFAHYVKLYKFYKQRESNSNG